MDKGSVTNSMNSHLGSEIAALQRFGENYARQISRKEKELKRLEEEIKQMETKIQEERGGGIKQGKKEVSHASIGTIGDLGKEKKEDIKRKIKSLEHQVDKERQKYNQSVAVNRQLREQIDCLRRERVVFDKIYQNLEKELERKKNKMVKTIAKAEDAYVKREFAKMQMKEMKKQIEEEKKDFEEQWGQIEKMIKNSQQMQEYTKNQESNKVNHTESKDMYNLNELKNEEEELKKRVHESMNKVNEYQKALHNIKKETGLNDIDELVKAFVNAEEDNLSLFNYVTELTNEVISRKYIHRWIN